jgi:hypothetical protein
MVRAVRMRSFAIAASGVSLAVAMSTAAPGLAHAATAPHSAVTAVTSLSIPGNLSGVAATSASNAWAVGYTDNGKTLIVHWNGTKWSQVTSPKPITGALYGVAAVSASDVWAVGAATVSGPKQQVPLIMHWNGKAWTRQATPTVAGYLDAVAAWGNNVWVGGSTTNIPSVGFFLHRTGGSWSVVPVQHANVGVITGVAMTGANTAWAIGEGTSSTSNSDCHLWRWGGSLWEPAAAPQDKGDCDDYESIAAGPHGTVWVTGESEATKPGDGGCCNSWDSSMFWNGKAWTLEPVPLPENNINGLEAVGVAPNSTAWAVDGAGYILHWTGRAWHRTATGNIWPNSDFGVFASAATSTSNAWMVGGLQSTAGKPTTTLVLHWDGTSWTN